jgi:hypothetical protein
MAYAVSGWFDEATAAQVHEIWNNLHESGICSVMHEGPYRPHVTFGIYEGLDVEALRVALGNYTEGLAPLPCKLAYVGIFNNDLPTLFLAMTLSPALLNVHAEVHRYMSIHGTSPQAYYLYGHWHPHCTVSPGLPTEKLQKAWGLLQKVEVPIVGEINRLGIIETPAEVELATLPLTG